MDTMDFNEHQEFRAYENRLNNYKSRDYTDEELEEWRQWAEKWAEDE